MLKDISYPFIESVSGGFKVHMSKGYSLPGVYLNERDAEKGKTWAIGRKQEAMKESATKKRKEAKKDNKG